MLRGREIYLCDDCGWVTAPRGYTGCCPRCGRALMSFACTRCMHLWVPRTRAAPKTCPRCKSPYWNRVRDPTAKRAMVTAVNRSGEAVVTVSEMKAAAAAEAAAAAATEDMNDDMTDNDTYDPQVGEDHREDE